MNPPQRLVECYVIGDQHLIDMACEEHAREYAAEHGLTWDNDNTANWTEEHSGGHYAYALWPGDGESDYPYTCYLSDCDIYLETRLTVDGEDYVRKNYAPEWWHLWGVEDVADLVMNGE